MEEWHIVAAEDFCLSVRDGTHNSPKRSDFGQKLVTSRHIIGGRIDLESAYLISDADYLEINRRSKVDRWDVLISMIGTVGEPCLVSEDPKFAIKNIGLFKSKDATCGKWLYYYLLAPGTQDIIRQRTSGTTQAYVALATLRSLPISAPKSTVEMAAIVDCLSTLDDKIELNRRMCETLESMARALFRDWFVDFGPTRAKMAGAAPYLAADLWSLFPDRLDDEGKPEGWENGNLGRIAQSKNRGVSPADVHHDTPYIGLEHMPRGSIALNEWEGAGKVTSNKSSFEAGDFLFGKLRPYFHKVGIAPVAGICSTDIVVVGPRTPSWHAFVIACISDEDFVAYTDKTATGTKMPRTSWPVMAKYKLMIPPDALAHCFNSIVAPKLEKIRVNMEESRTLAETRDLLLPRLMSGELRVAGAERVLDEVL